MPAGPWIPDQPRAPAPSLGGALETDCVVIGSGIAGASLARQLAEAGMDVILIDRGVAAHGASGRNAGFLLADGARSFASVAETQGALVARVLRGLGHGTRAIVRELAASRPEIALDPCGSVRLAATPEEVSELSATARTLRGPLQLLTADELARLGLPAGLYQGGLLDPGDSLLDPIGLVHALLDRFDAAGGRRFERSPVTNVDEVGDRVLVRTATGSVSATQAVLATNAWARELLDVPIRPVRAQMLEAELDAPLAWEHAFYADGGADYWRRTAPTRLVLGGRRAEGGADEETDQAEAGGDVQASLDALLAELVGREGVRIVRRWAGIMAFTPDGLPVAGRAPSRERIYLMAGMNGQGMGWAPGLALLLAEELLGRGPAVPACIGADRFKGATGGAGA